MITHVNLKALTTACTGLVFIFKSFYICTTLQHNQIDDHNAVMVHKLVRFPQFKHCI